MTDPVERTNRFYIEMSRKVLSEKEYELLQKLLIEKITRQQAALLYGISMEQIDQVYKRTYNKVKSATEILGEIDHYKKRLQELKNDAKNAAFPIKKMEIKLTEDPDRSRILQESTFVFSNKMLHFFADLELHTIGQLAEIPLNNFHLFRGFKMQLKKELVAFIVFENIERHFKGFSTWKKKLIEQ
ncbi:hypothetical protein [Flavobacterium sp. TAB 87]|uniref:hypothetical protein n=1 Tax=Flavobacterium sp. TAB 87 TaxID=1729581 RepID=UPI000830C809|nr:hypothetical protein [Flavobacterium sp. TAB 87]